jgi:DNA-directed RNA polymerase specialized sigma24 family protein
MGMGDEQRVRAQLAGLSDQVKLIGADHIVHGLTAVEISALRGIPLITVKRAIAAVYAAIDRAGARRPAPIRANNRHVAAGFTPALQLAL